MKSIENLTQLLNILRNIILPEEPEDVEVQLQT